MLKDKFPLKVEKDVQKMIETIEKGTIEEWMWMKILDKIYEERDAKVLQDRIREMILLRS
jgi:hypothetical protein